MCRDSGGSCFFVNLFFYVGFWRFGGVLFLEVNILCGELNCPKVCIFFRI